MWASGRSPTRSTRAAARRCSSTGHLRRTATAHGRGARSARRPPQVEAANAKAVERLLAAQPRLEAWALPARRFPGMGRRTMLHAGPPIEWDGMCGPMQGAIIGAILFEGWADHARGRGALAASGEVDVRAVPPPRARSGRWPASSARRCRCGSSRMPTGGNRAFCNLNEGLGKVLRFGANFPTCIDTLALDGERRSRRRCSRGVGRARRARAQAADGAGAAHGRRVPQPQRRGVLAACSSGSPRRC